MLRYTRLAAEDPNPRIRVNAISPGPIRTPALESFLEDDVARTAIEQATPLHRIGTTADIAAAVVYLTSPASAFMTGANLTVSGGQRSAADLPLRTWDAP